MADTIPSHYTQEFSNNWQARTGQKKARLDEWVLDEDFQGERKRWNRMEEVASRLRTERKGPTQIQDFATDFRYANRKSYECAQLLDKDDAKNLGQLVLPTGDLVTRHANAFNRDKDDVAWTAALGNALTGEEATTLTALPEAQKIVHGGVGLTLGKLRSANGILGLADEDDEDVPRVMCVTQQQLDNLLADTTITSADYNTVKALVDGHVDSFMGFKFKRIKRLGKVSTTRTCVAWVKGAIKRFIGEKMSDISLRKDLSYSTQVYSSWMLGAVRFHDELVVSIECTEV